MNLATISGLKKILNETAVYLAYILTCVFALGPILWVVSTSFKEKGEVYDYPPAWIPRNPTVDNYVKIFTRLEIQQTFFNSTMVAIISTLLILALASLAAYGFSRFLFRGKQALMLAIIGTQMIPAVTNIIPIYVIANRLGLLDTLTALWLVYAAVSLPFSVWLLKSYFDSIPRDIDDAALIDGCTRLGTLFRIVLPVSWPGLVACALFSFVASWSEFYLALVLTSSIKSRTLPVALFLFQGTYDIQWNLLGAASVAAMIPVVIVFVALQNRLVSGLTAGALK